MPDYITSRNGTLHFRMVVPRELRPVVGKREIKRTLRTSSPLAGRLRALALAVHYSEQWDRMRNPTTNLVSIISDNGRVTVVLDNPTADEKVDAATVAKALTSTTPAATLPIDELWALYSKEKMATAGWTAKTLNEMHNPVRRYQAHCDKHAVNPHLKTSASSYKAELLSTLTTATVNQHIDRLGAMFRWGMDNGHLPASGGNPFDKLQVKEGARAKAARNKSRVPYTHAEIDRVLAALDTNANPRHWLPLLGMYTGARIGELAQLYVDDIQEEACSASPGESIAFIHIRPSKTDQRTKNHKSRRVPIHPELIRRGFLEYVDQLRREGKPRLFDVFTHGRDGYGQGASRWYNGRFRPAIGLERDFHSYRHTVSAALDEADVTERVKNAIFGHSHGKTMSETVYGHELPLAVVKQAIDKLSTNPGRK